MDSQMVETLLARLDCWLAANRPSYYARLQAGVTGAQLNAFEERFSLKLPTPFRQLYHWRNGQESACSASFQNNWMFSPLEEIAETKEVLDGMIGYDFDDPRYWRRGWVPFLHNGGGSHLCLDLAAEDGGQRDQLVAFWKSDADRPVKYSSLEAWLVDLVTSLEDASRRLP